MKALVIPSAVLVPHDMRKQFGELPTALFPLGKMTMIEQLYKKYVGSVDAIYLIVYKKKYLITDYIKLKKLPIKIIELDKLSDLGYSIRYGLSEILHQKEDIDYLYINFADSLLDDRLPADTDKDFVYYSHSDSPEAWTYFDEQDGRITSIIDKNDIDNHPDEVKMFGKVFVGVFGFADIKKFIGYIDTDNGIVKSMDSFYTALWRYSSDHEIDFIKSEHWFDVGHGEKYLEAQTNVAARAFNSIKIDEKRGILTKHSENKAKLIDEIKWYLKLPNKLQYLLPRIYDYSLDMANPYVKMEYYGYHTLHESLMYGNLPLVRWQNIFKKILFAISDMSKYRVNGTPEECKTAMRSIYIVTVQ